MKLYMHPVSIASRPVSLFIAENELEFEQRMVDGFAQSLADQQLEAI